MSAQRMPKFGALKKRALNCLEAGAMATSCTMTHDWIEPYYADMIDNETICTLYSTNASRLGRSLMEPDNENKVVEAQTWEM